VKQKFLGDTYGEIKEEGIKSLIKQFQEYFDDPNAVFYDLGSGKGDMVIYIASNTNVKKACGIELHTERCNEAKEKLNAVDLNNVSFINENFLDSDISDATIIYCDNQLIPEEVIQELWKNIPKKTLVMLSKRYELKYRYTREHLKKSYGNVRIPYIVKE